MNQFYDWYLQYHPSMVKICVIDQNDNHQIGTGFHIGDGCIATARHVVEGHKQVEIFTEIYATGSNPKQELVDYRPDVFRQLEIQRVFTPVDQRIDLAVVKTDFTLEYYMNKVHIQISETEELQKTDHLPIAELYDDHIADSDFLLSKVLLMGYPPIPLSMYAVLVAIEAQVNAVVDKYTSPHVHLVLSSTARGGLSGGPVIDRFGQVIAVCTEALTKGNGVIETGFTAAICVEPLVSLLADNNIFPASNARLAKYFKYLSEFSEDSIEAGESVFKEFDEKAYD